MDDSTNTNSSYLDGQGKDVFSIGSFFAPSVPDGMQKSGREDTECWDVALLNTQMQNFFTGIKAFMLLYRSGLKEVGTKLEILSEEFQQLHAHNPIEHINYRIKTPKSIFQKLARKGLDISPQSAREHLNDIAGVRVICSFKSDVYDIARVLKSQNDVKLIRETDYIKNPKPSGYRSLHLVVEVPVFFSDRVEQVRVEVQIRTIAMDFWASLDHKLHYKFEQIAPEGIVADLKECANVIDSLDERMSEIHNRIQRAEE